MWTANERRRCGGSKTVAKGCFEPRKRKTSGWRALPPAPVLRCSRAARSVVQSCESGLPFRVHTRPPPAPVYTPPPSAHRTNTWHAWHVFLEHGVTWIITNTIPQTRGSGCKPWTCLAGACGVQTVACQHLCTSTARTGQASWCGAGGCLLS